MKTMMKTNYKLKHIYFISHFRAYQYSLPVYKTFSIAKTVCFISFSSSLFSFSPLLNPKSNQNSNPQLGFYLAGLIEGDGNIWTSKTLKSPKGRINNPQITFPFHIKERAFFAKMKCNRFLKQEAYINKD